MDNLFKRSERNTYSNKEKLNFGEIQRRENVEIKRNGEKTKFDAKRKKHMAKTINQICHRNCTTDLCRFN